MVKYFKNQTIQVFYAKGTVTTKFANGQWQTVDKNGNGSATPIRSVMEKKYPSARELVQREDGVTVESQQTPYFAQSKHADGTHISATETKSNITTVEGVSLSFDATQGCQEVTFEDYSITRDIVDGKTVKISIQKVNFH
jgi:hypothetical protein